MKKKGFKCNISKILLSKVSQILIFSPLKFDQISLFFLLPEKVLETPRYRLFDAVLKYFFEHIFNKVWYQTIAKCILFHSFGHIICIIILIWNHKLFRSHGVLWLRKGEICHFWPTSKQNIFLNIHLLIMIFAQLLYLFKHYKFWKFHNFWLIIGWDTNDWNRCDSAQVRKGSKSHKRLHPVRLTHS